ncbi:hypothetical protein P7K49_013595 [Saguinus oedipus]|uniref:Uncharacterized protein n=1 Tax=Saguinus oedipus TaxID=9490 RepID=A0ABQ9VGW6_SAGOE|nr:hypothetical protein P7K49_013595 [Saguinus oedipus]
MFPAHTGPACRLAEQDRGWRPHGAGAKLTCVLPAGLVKSEMEAQTGLQILQTGVGQVCANWRISQGRQRADVVHKSWNFLPGDVLTGSVAWDGAEEQLRNLPMPLPPLILALFPQREEAAAVLPRTAHSTSPMHSVLLTLVALAGVAGLLVALAVALCVRQHARQRDKERLAALGPEGAHGDTTFEYQDLCRQHMATKSLFTRAEGPPEPSRVSSVSSQFSDVAQASPSSHSSTPSWCEEPAQANMDISTGHMILVRTWPGPRVGEGMGWQERPGWLCGPEPD